MTVLLVEPAATFAQFLKLILIRLGYTVVHVPKPTDIRKDIVGHSPDLIISEAGNGLDICRLVKGDDSLSGIPVVIVSTDGCRETREAAQQAGCADYLTKPVRSRDIHAIMQKHLPFHFKRHSLRASMVLTAVVSDGSRSLEEKVVTMGEGGLFIETANRRPVGTRLDFSLPLPRLKGPVRLQGEVIYLKDAPDGSLPAGMGVKFIAMDPNTATLLHFYMENYLADFWPEGAANKTSR